ncbi:hypothetical protein J0895_06810 [Phormidium pseudopriestleyi FRX01]|uniref:Uncharacterized protein n=1 Tax=Phormidium pseudopriestleyi FRX01 TaxID=1759528 RepID=A0ABS3FNW1_9CYAN|nr:hypothetical protein [Phormidium pseudopriestleyi FRX01]
MGIDLLPAVAIAPFGSGEFGKLYCTPDGSRTHKVTRVSLKNRLDIDFERAIAPENLQNRDFDNQTMSDRRSDGHHEDHSGTHRTLKSQQCDRTQPLAAKQKQIPPIAQQP